MRTALFCPLLLFTGLVWADVGSRLAAASEPLQTSEHLLVLRNGSILRGQISRQGTHYTVVFPRGEIQVPAGQVEFCCASLDEAYLQRRATRTGSSADTHVQLAKWCLRHDLLEQATRELRDARAIDPQHSGFGAIEWQIRQATRTMRHPGTDGNVDPESPPVLPEKSAATHEIPPVAIGGIEAEKHEPKSTPSLAGISKPAHSQFVRRIEPMLLHNCTTNGCHRGGSPQQFQLNRLATIGSGHSDLTRQNLAAVVGQLDADLPAGSPLLARAAVSHGNVSHGNTASTQSAPLDAQQLHILRDWVRLLAVAEVQEKRPMPPVSKLAAMEARQRLMRRWDKRSSGVVPDRVVVRRASAPIYYHPSQTIRIQPIEPPTKSAEATEQGAADAQAIPATRQAPITQQASDTRRASE